MKRSKSKTVYVSHSAKQPIDSLKKLLQAEGVEILDSFDISAPNDLNAFIERGIRSADSVIAIIDSDANNVMFELGFATALRKPILLLLLPGTANPLFTLHERYLVTDLSDSEVLRLAVKKFLQKSSRQVFHGQLKGKHDLLKHSNRQTVANLQHQVSLARQSAIGVNIERLVQELMKAVLPNAMQEHQSPIDKGVDMAIWSDELQPSFGNPVLIEIKAGDLSRRKIEEAYERLVHQVGTSGAGAGILLYLDRHNQRFSRPTLWHPNVLAFDVEDFINELQTKSLAKVLIERRNRIVHGLSD